MIPEGRQSPIGSPDFTAGRPNSGKGRPHLPAVKRVRGMRHPAPSLHDAPDSTGRGHRLLNSKHHTPDMYPPPRHVNPQTRERRPLPHGKSRRLSIPHAYACLYRAPTGTRTQNTRILSPLSLPIGLWGRTPHSSGHKHLLFHENAPEPKQKHISNGSPNPAVASIMQKHWWAAKLDSSQTPRRKIGGAED